MSVEDELLALEQVMRVLHRTAGLDPAWRFVLIAIDERIDTLRQSREVAPEIAGDRAPLPTRVVH
jgi:hypothetical protein